MCLLPSFDVTCMYDVKVYNLEISQKIGEFFQCCDHPKCERNYNDSCGEAKYK